MFEVSGNTASRHLNELVELNQRQKAGKGRYTNIRLINLRCMNLKFGA